MKLTDVEKFLLALPRATLSIQWGNDRVFKVAGKMFAVIGFYENKKFGGMSFKASEESFRILTELPGIKPAPYLARAHAIVAGGLPKKTQRELGLIK